MTAPAGIHHLTGGDVSLVLEVAGGDARVLHWGERLPDAPALDPALLVPGRPHSSFDVPVRRSLIAQPARGWRGRPGLRGDRDGRGFSPRLVATDVAGTAHTCTLTFTAADAELDVRVHYELTASGLLLVGGTVANTGDDDYRLQAFDLVLPVPARATEMMDLAGRWSGERRPQRRPVQQGVWTRQARHGRTGHDAALLMAAGTPAFTFRRGEVWAAHLGWSGDHEEFVEQTADGTTALGAGELLDGGEIVLHPGESYDTPTLYAAWSDKGLDGVSTRFHSWLRGRDAHPTAPRPVTLNTWEAVYFRQNLTDLAELADRAADLGIERFVLDDGWFRSRRDDTAGLGDWFVDEHTWPDGLTPLIDHVRGLGMQFGLWVEPEMVDVDSDLARAHPDWISTPRPRADGGDRLAVPWRHQHVLDLVNPDAWAWVYDRIHALLRDNRIDCLKWDDNRDDVELAHDGRPSTHAQTLALYRLLDALRAAHPHVEIESCSSGGGRVDLGILARTDRVWASDTNDALERQHIQRFTSLVVPPELIGAHVGPPRSHTTGRVHDISFRAATALIAHMGVEWDIRRAAPADADALRDAIALHKRHRDLIATGDMVRVDCADPSATVTGVVAPDRRRAVFVYARLTASAFETPEPVRFAGLDREATYTVQVAQPAPRSLRSGLAQPEWLDAETVVGGAVLETIGLPAPLLHPAAAVVVELSAATA